MKSLRLSGPVLHAMRAFGAAARNLSFARAADDLSVTPGAISQQIKLLEERLGTRLFERHPRGLSLTIAGAQLALAVDNAFCTLEDALATLSPADAMRTLDISCTTSFALMWLIPRLGEFNRIHPNFQLRIKAEFHRLDPAQMKHEGIDLAIRYDVEDFPGFEVTHLMNEVLLPVASTSYLQRFPVSELLANPEGRVLLHDAFPWNGAPPFAEWREWLDGAAGTLPLASWRQSLAQGAQFNLSQLGLQAAMAGQGLAIGRGSLILEDIEQHRLLAPWNELVISSARYVLLELPEVVRRVDAGPFTDWLVQACRRFEVERDTVFAR